MKQMCPDCFEALSVKSRFEIFEYLKKHKKGTTISELVDVVNLRQPTVTFHIQRLIERGIVKTEKKGREVYCYAYKKCSRCPLFFNS